jgi:DNA-binding XRE family transcriptional regulator
MGKLPKRTLRTIHLAEWMTALEWTPTTLAKDVGVTSSYISNLCAAKKQNPSSHVMYDISRVMGITVNDLYQLPPAPGVMAVLSAYSPAARQALLTAQPKKK